jgi:hypothetical protein
MSEVQEQTKTNNEIHLHCPVNYCDRAVTRVVRENDYRLISEPITGQLLDCNNETHAHYSCGALVRLKDNRKAYTMTEAQRQEYDAFKLQVVKP